MADVRVRRATRAAQSLCLLVFVARGAAAGQIPKTYHVAVDGDDSADGSAKKPWRTPAVALKKVTSLMKIWKAKHKATLSE